MTKEDLKFYEEIVNKAMENHKKSDLYLQAFKNYYKNRKNKPSLKKMSMEIGCNLNYEKIKREY